MILNNEDGMAEFGAVSGGLVGLVGTAALGYVVGQEATDLVSYFSQVEPSTVKEIIVGGLVSVLALKNLSVAGYTAELGEKLFTKPEQSNQIMNYK